MSAHDMELKDVLDRAGKAFSQGKWVDSASILSEALEAMEKVDTAGLSREDLSEDQRKALAREATLRVRLGHSLRRMGRFQEGHDEFQRAKGTAELIGDDGVLADSLLGLGFFEWGRGSYSKAKTLFWEAIERADRVKDQAIKGRAYMGLGNIALVTRRMEEGVSAFTKALAYLEKVEGTEIERARVMHNQAFVIFKQGRRSEAEEAFKRCVNFAEAQGDLSTSGFAYSNLAHLYVEEGRIAEAESTLEKAGRLIARTNDKYGLTLIVWVNGLLKAKKGNLEGAIESYQKAIRSYESMKLPGQMLHMTVDYIPVFVEAGRKAEIVEIVQRLKKAYKDKGITYLLEKLERAEKDLLADG